MNQTKMSSRESSWQFEPFDDFYNMEERKIYQVAVSNNIHMEFTFMDTILK